MANILFVAYDYPPILSPEAIQVQRRALALANNGHHVKVITSHQAPMFEFNDESLIEKHENIEIVNTAKPSFEKLRNLYCKVLDLTDRKLWWKSYALEKAQEVIRSEKIDILYTHSTPLVDHVVGLELKEQYGLNWVAHLSDPWVDNPYKSYRFDWQRNSNRRLESKIFEKCDKLTVTSLKTKELFEKTYKNINGKTYVLPHTFDERKFVNKRTDFKKKVVVHTGNIYGLRSISALLKSLSENKVADTEFHFYGKIKQEELDLVSRYGLEDIVKTFSQVSYNKSLEIISEADALMVVDAPLKNSPFFPSKLADYIGANKPILALSPKGSATVDILRHIENDTMVASSDDVDGITEILKKMDLSEITNKNRDHYSLDNYNLLRDVFEK